MAQVTITIPNDKVDDVIEACKHYRAIPKNGDGTPKFTDSAWVKEIIIEFIKQLLRAKKREVALAAITDTVDVT